MARVTLSFDNGPDPVITPRVLDVLARHAISASFFVVGRQLQDAGARRATGRAAAEGHRIGNHSFSHAVPFGLNDDPDAIADEVERTQAMIETFAAGELLFRPFGGDGGALDGRLMSRALVGHLCARGFTCVLWNAVPRDWEDPDGWVETAMAQVAGRDWSLVVLHDIVPGAELQLERFIARLHDGGHDIVEAFPPSCTPIVNGKEKEAMDHLIGR